MFKKKEKNEKKKEKNEKKMKKNREKKKKEIDVLLKPQQNSWTSSKKNGIHTTN